MKLTVALRIIGGFSVISLLLLIIGFTAYNRLNTISSATAEVNNVSIPALENSALMKSEFVVMSKLSLQAFNAEQLSEVATLKARFSAEQKIYEASAQRLSTAVSNEASLKQAAAAASSAYNEFVPVSKRLFEQLEAGLTLRDSIDNKLSELEMHADDMASLILDFTDVRDVQKRFPRSYQAATSIETGINTLISNVVDLNRTQSDTTATTISNEIDFRLKDLNEQFVTIKAETADKVALVSDLEEKVGAINALLQGANGIPSIKATRLKSNSEATALLATLEQQATEAVKVLEGLLQKAGTAAESIQQEAKRSVSSAVTFIFVVMSISVAVAIAVTLHTVRSITTPLAKVNEILELLPQVI